MSNVVLAEKLTGREMSEAALEATRFRGALGCQTKVPLATHERLVTRVAKYLRKCHNALIEIAFISRHACEIEHQHAISMDWWAIRTSLRGSVELAAFGTVLPRHVRPLDEIAKAGDMIVCASHDHRARRGARGGGVKVSEA